MPEYVLRLSLEEDSGGNAAVLVNVQAPEEEDGDLVIEGTEGETPYVATFSPKALSAARSSGSPIPASAWKETLVHLLQYGPRPLLPEPAPSLSLTASLEASKFLTLHMRQTVAGGISQRLGELQLRANPEHEIDTLAWTATAVQRSIQLTRERDAATQQVKSIEGRAEALSGQLEELVKARNDSENAMLVAFADLLNEKKRKVRELQRCVEELQISADMNTKKETKVEETKTESKQSSSTSKRKAIPSRRGKRKANVEPEVPVEADAHGEEVDENDQMEDDQASNESSGFERILSPGAEREDESTDAGSGDEIDKGEGQREASQPRPKRGVGKIGGQLAMGSKTPANEGDGKDYGRTVPMTETAEVPPRRELPFTRQQKVEQTEDMGKGADTSDDEL